MVEVKGKPRDFIKFLGTAGARFVMIRQLRASGGLWVYCRGTNVLIDPGPGSIVRCALSRPKLDPEKLDGIILTHRHLDHSGDLSVMIEAMTEGGFKRRGVVFCPADTLEEGAVILRHALNFPEKIELLKEEGDYSVGNFSFSTSPPHLHSVATFGLKFALAGKSVAWLTDTRYFPGLANFYGGLDVLLLSVVFYEPRPGVDHLSLYDAENIIAAAKPKKTILTHFGMTMLKAKPHLQAQKLSAKLGQEVVAAYDGMTMEFP
jgi:ribonuclease BN (tRNA processing enzyme)